MRTWILLAGMVIGMSINPSLQMTESTGLIIVSFLVVGFILDICQFLKNMSRD